LLLSIHSLLQFPLHSCLHLLSSSQMPSSSLLWQLTYPSPALPWHPIMGLAWGSLLVPICWPHACSLWVSWATWGVTLPCISFPSIPLQGHGACLSPYWVLPVSQARSIKDTQLPRVRVPHSSGFTPPQGGLQIPALGGGGGGGGGAGRLEGKSSAGVDSAHCALYSGQSPRGKEHHRSPKCSL
jgi:hypothetical protein